MPDPNLSNNNTLIIGPIDTPAEVHQIYRLFRECFRNKYPTALRSEVLSSAEANMFLTFLVEARKKQSLSTTVNTAAELELLIKKFKEQDNIIDGAVDTPEEVKIFTKMLKEEGILIAALAGVRSPIPKPKMDEAPRKRRRSVPDDDEEDDRPSQKPSL